MKLSKGVKIVLAVWLAVLLSLAWAVANATDYGDDLVAEANANTGDLVGGSMTSRSLALTSVMGDVDIAQCLASTQWSLLIFAKQGVQLNQWCAALWYDQHGMHDMAAKLRCNIPEIAGEFDTDPECVTGNTMPSMGSSGSADPRQPETTRSGMGLAGSLELATEILEDAAEEEDHDEAIAALRADFEADQAARRRAGQRAAAKRQADAEQLDAYIDQYEQLIEPQQAIEEAGQ